MLRRIKFHNKVIPMNDKMSAATNALNRFEIFAATTPTAGFTFVFE